jgi:hypothetical protein
MKRNVSEPCYFLATNGTPGRQLLKSCKHFMCQPAAMARFDGGSGAATRVRYRSNATQRSKRRDADIIVKRWFFERQDEQLRSIGTIFIELTRALLARSYGEDHDHDFSKGGGRETGVREDL